MPPDVADFLIRVAAICAALLTIGALLTALRKTRVVRYVWRHLVAEPFGTWVREQVDEAIKPVRAELADVAAEVTATGIALGDHMVDELAEGKLDRIDRVYRQRRSDSQTRDLWRAVNEIRASIRVMHGRIDRWLGLGNAEERRTAENMAEHWPELLGPDGDGDVVDLFEGMEADELDQLRRLSETIDRDLGRGNLDE